MEGGGNSAEEEMEKGTVGKGREEQRGGGKKEKGVEKRREKE